MDISQDKLRNLREMRYEGTGIETRKTALSEYQTKEYSSHTDVAELFRENTKLDVPGDVFPFTRRSVGDFVSSDTLVYATRTPMAGYRNNPAIELPEPGSIAMDLTTTLTNRRSHRTFTGDSIPTADISTLLDHACGSKRSTPAYDVPPVDTDESTIKHHARTYPSPGGLYSVETYLIVTKPTTDLDVGAYHYEPETHQLRDVKPDSDDVASDFRSLWAKGGGIDYKDAAVALLFTGAFGRVKAKYGPRGHRLLLEEAGHICQNAQLVATALGHGSVPCAGYSEDAVAEFLGLNDTNEGIVHSLIVGGSEAK